MPYMKRTRAAAFNGGAYPKRRSMKRRRYSAPAKTARNNQRTGGFIGQELNYYDSEVNTFTVGTTWTTAVTAGATDSDALNTPQQGDGETQRTGRNINQKSIMVRGEIEIPNVEGSNSTIGDTTVTCLLVLDQQTNGAQFEGNDLMLSNANPDSLGFRNLEFTTRFKILKRKVIYMKPNFVNEGAVQLFANGPAIKEFSMYYKFPQGLKTQYCGTTQAIANIVDNSLHFIMIANGATTTATYNARLRFFS